MARRCRGIDKLEPELKVAKVQMETIILTDFMSTDLEEMGESSKILVRKQKIWQSARASLWFTVHDSISD